MYNAKYILTGLVVVVAIFTSPFWFPKKAKEIKIDLKLPAGETACVEDTPTMRASHMAMLNDWRNRVIRDGERLYTNAKGRQFAMSLTNTCMSCHDDKAGFCDRCHNTVNISPHCWDCHNTSPKGSK